MISDNGYLKQLNEPLEKYLCNTFKTMDFPVKFDTIKSGLSII